MLTSLFTRGDITTAFAHRQEPTAIVVTPTRELAVQIKDEGRKFSAGIIFVDNMRISILSFLGSMVNVCVIYGGTSVRQQFEGIQRGCNVLVAPPGRLMQFITEGRVGLSKCRYIVLDEADRMLDLGFEPTVSFYCYATLCIVSFLDSKTHGIARTAAKRGPTSDSDVFRHVPSRNPTIGSGFFASLRIHHRRSNWKRQSRHTPRNIAGAGL